jgi:hypothetical protein
MSIRIHTPHAVIVAFWTVAACSALGQDGANNQAAQKDVTELRESLAANHAKLKTYQWSQTTVVSIKGTTTKG